MREGIAVQTEGKIMTPTPNDPLENSRRELVREGNSYDGALTPSCLVETLTYA